jgi:hypothetical protein|tara:strand:+ start:2345 stop:2539 length:195 start_codon:yes stop_codon:yes gene_type:complete
MLVNINIKDHGYKTVDCVKCNGTGSTATGTQMDSDGNPEQCYEPCSFCKSLGYVIRRGEKTYNE